MGDGKKMERQGHFISFGNGTTLYSEEWLLDAMGNGMNRRALRALCEALGVPMLHLGERRYIDQFTLCLALRMVLGPGEPSFAAPGSTPVKRGRTEGMRTRLEPDEVRSNIRVVVRELLSARMAAGTGAEEAVRSGARAVAQRFVEAGMQLTPSLVQAEVNGAT